MCNKRIKLVFRLPIIAVMFLFSCLFSANAQGITGIWLTEKDESKVEITERNGAFFGKVIWVKEQTEKAQKGVGITVLRDFVLQNDNSYKGTIFAPHLNKTVKGTINQDNENEITVRGYLGISIFGSSQKWKRVKN